MITSYFILFFLVGNAPPVEVARFSEKVDCKISSVELNNAYSGYRTRTLCMEVQ